MSREWQTTAYWPNQAKNDSDILRDVNIYIQAKTKNIETICGPQSHRKTLLISELDVKPIIFLD